MKNVFHQNSCNEGSQKLEGGGEQAWGICATLSSLFLAWEDKNKEKRTEEWALIPAKKKELRLEKWL